MFAFMTDMGDMVMIVPALRKRSCFTQKKLPDVVAKFVKQQLVHKYTRIMEANNQPKKKLFAPEKWP